MASRPSWYSSRSILSRSIGGCLLGALILTSLPAHGQQRRPQEFGGGALRQLDQLPSSRLRSQLNALPGAAQKRSLQWLQSFHFTEDDLPYLHTDAQGGIFYVCPPVGAAAVTPPLEPEMADTSEAPVPVTPFPESLIFHSKPGAPNVLFLNFSGERVSNTEWNDSLGRSVIVARAFSTDSNATQFSDSEQTAIKRIWQRVAEDYAPFNVDVTTERPQNFNSRTAHALITRSTDVNGEPNPAESAGGVAYVNVFGTQNFARFRPGWVYHNNLANDAAYTAEAASHEIGHNLGLSHDGATDGSEYYSGHGSGDTSWSAIMGVSYDRNVSQWSKGEYRLANNTQDDLATIAGKMSYRVDDHGNTLATATPLVLTNGTQVVATNPDNDPTNQRPANKGIISRNNDVEVFSFVTGNGPIRLAVTPWVTPGGGSRGGNLDVVAELSNSAGTLLLTDNPPNLTSALIQTNLPAGRYYLTVRNSGSGNPQAASPTGYTIYGSLGQFFINGTVTLPDGVVIPPLAELQPADLSVSGQTTLPLVITYADDTGIDVGTLDSLDVRVTGPNNFNRLAQFVSVDAAGNGTPRVATYALASPDGSQWAPADNGTYTVTIEAGQVKDIQGAPVPAGQLGQLEVTVPRSLYVANMDSSPGWTLESQWGYGLPRYLTRGPTNGFTGSRIVGYRLGADYTTSLQPRYATTPAIDCSSVLGVSLRFKRWLRVQPNDPVSIQVSTNGTTWTNVWSTIRGVFDTNWVSVQYPMPEGIAGNNRVRFRWSMASAADRDVDIGWNLDDVEVIGSGFVDSKPPTAELLVADLTIKGSPAHSCSVTFTDETAVRLSSLDSTDLRVTGPNGYSKLINFEGVDLPLDGSPATASYSIPAPATTWSAADNGTYTITLMSEAVEDTSGNMTPEKVLGTFQVAISLVEPGVLEVTPATLWSAEGPQGGPFVPATRQYTLTNRGGAALNWTSDTLFDWLGLSSAQGTLEPGQSTNVTVSFQGPAGSLSPGVNAGWVNFANTTSGLGNTRREVELTVLAGPQVELKVSVNEPTWGRVEPTGGSFPVGTSVELTAIPSTYYRFQNWGGDAPGTANPQTVVLSKSLNVLAVFQEILTVNHPTPHWWLASQGFTQNFETAVDVIGANGMPVWQSYIAGLNPNDPTSRLVLTSVPAPSGNQVVLNWNTVPGRVYTVRSSSALPGSFEPVAGAINLPATTQSFTAPVVPGTTTFYKIEVLKP